MDQLDADRDAQHFKGLANAVLRRLARERDDDPGRRRRRERINTPDWLWQRWVATYGEANGAGDRRRPPPRADASTSPSRAIPRHWAETLGGIVLPTGTVRLVADRRDRGAARLCRRRMVGAGRRRRASRAASRRCRRQARRRSLRRARRQDRAACRRRRQASPPSTSRPSGSNGCRSNLARLQPDRRDGRRRRPRLDSRRSRSTPSSSTRRARRPAPSAAIPDVAWLKRPKARSPSSPASRPSMIDRAVGWLKPGGTLVYCTCSLEPEEGEDQIARALHRHGISLVAGRRRPRSAASARRSRRQARSAPCRPIWSSTPPRLSGLDGFFAARLGNPEQSTGFEAADKGHDSNKMTR